MSGQFVISLDFELHWGLRDLVTLEAARLRLEQERRAVRELAALFAARGIHATWATIGFLFATGRSHALRHGPRQRPTYRDSHLDPYPTLEATGESEERDPWRFAASLVDLLAKTPYQELASHTFSHYYCLEPGQTLEQFRDDLAAAASIGSPYGSVLTSIVFPRNQFSPAHLQVAKQAGVRVYRGNPSAWFWQPRAYSTESRSQRLFRFSDAYLPVGGQKVQRVSRDESGLVNVPATRFLRPFSPQLAPVEPLKLRRVAVEMDAAAFSGGLFHLWWHPFNFATHLEENLAFLNRVFDHFELLQRRTGMRSLTMAEAATLA